MTKNALLKRGPKNSGMGRPPPPHPSKKNLFSLLRSSLRQYGSRIICSIVNFLLYLLADGSGSGEGSGQEAAGSGEDEVDCEERLVSISNDFDNNSIEF